jgi:hypothetical protein
MLPCENQKQQMPQFSKTNNGPVHSTNNNNVHMNTFSVDFNNKNGKNSSVFNSY